MLVRVMVILCSLLAISSRGSAEPHQLKVGVILPLSGKAAGVGVAIRNGISMALEALPVSKREALVVSFEDDGAESRLSVAAAQKIIAGADADVIISAFSNAGNAVVPLTERAGVPLISLAYDRGISNSSTSAFTFWVGADDLAAAAAREAVRRGYKRVAIVSTLHEGNRAMRSALEMAGAGLIDFPIEEEVLLGDIDLNGHVLRVKAGGGVDAAALLMHGGHLGQFVKALRANGLDFPLFTLGNFEDRGVRIAAGADLKGAWYSGTEYNSSFLKSYLERYPEQSTFGAAYGHDLVLLLAQVADRGLPASALVEFLNSATVSGGAFPRVVADGKHGFRFPVVIKTVGEDGIPYL